MDIKEAARQTKTTMIEPMREYNSMCKEGLSKAHIIWLLDGIICGYITGNKAQRWLGWAQCAVCVFDDTTLAELKEINRAATSKG